VSEFLSFAVPKAITLLRFGDRPGCCSHVEAAGILTALLASALINSADRTSGLPHRKVDRPAAEEEGSREKEKPVLLATLHSRGDKKSM